MTSKLIDLFKYCETFNELPAMEQVRVVFRTPSNICDGSLFKNTNVNLKPLTILAESSFLDDTWLGPE